MQYEDEGHLCQKFHSFLLIWKFFQLFLCILVPHQMHTKYLLKPSRFGVRFKINLDQWLLNVIKIINYLPSIYEVVSIFVTIFGQDWLLFLKLSFVSFLICYVSLVPLIFVKNTQYFCLRFLYLLKKIS